MYSMRQTAFARGSPWIAGGRHRARSFVMFERIILAIILAAYLYFGTLSAVVQGA